MLVLDRQNTMISDIRKYFPLHHSLVASSEVCSEQGCVYALSQDPSDPSADPGDICRQREGGEHGGVVEGRGDACRVRQ